jgi:hypothetical protein
MADDIARCELCGEPMPPGEEMFKFHGYSGRCPKPPLSKPTVEAVVEYLHQEVNGEFWLEIRANGEKWAQLGPFDTKEERQRAQDDMLSMMRQLGAKDLPGMRQ